MVDLRYDTSSTGKVILVGSREGEASIKYHTVYKKLYSATVV
jgi:hypothetical protein